MKKLLLGLLLMAGIAMNTNAQELCPCEMENKTDALWAVAMTHTTDNNIFSVPNLTESNVGDPWSAVAAIVGSLLSSLPETTYALKITSSDGEIKYAEVKSCQYCLEYTYDILQVYGVSSVRIISATWLGNVNPSCSNKTYYPSDLSDVKRRRDENFNY
ncbi:MAG: hypothetical protein MJZ76_00425 [Bacteroidales bacterium]|nr:hypothetical protein [Bacteroidales bacterium]